jgi:hypothetical protein
MVHLLLRNYDPDFAAPFWTVAYVMRRDRGEAMQEEMQSRRKEHANHGDELYPAKQGV